MSDADDDQPGRQARQRLGRKKTKERLDGGETDMPNTPAPGFSRLEAVSTSLESISIPPRTPRSGRTPVRQNGGLLNGYPSDLREDDNEVEISLLTEDERRSAVSAQFSDTLGPDDVKRPLTAKDKHGMVLLVVLCTCRYRLFSAAPFLTSLRYTRPHPGCSGALELALLCFEGINLMKSFMKLGLALGSDVLK